MSEQALPFEQLVEHFETSDPESKYETIYDIAHSNDLRASNWLLNAFEKADGKLKIDIMWSGLRFFEDSKTITTLIEAFGDNPERGINLCASSTLDHIGAPAVPLLLENLPTANPIAKSWIISILNVFSRERIVTELPMEPFNAILTSQDESDLKFRVLSLLQDFKHPDSIPVLLQALHNQNGGVSTEAASILQEFQVKEAIEPIHKLLDANTSQNADRFYLTALVGLIAEEKRLDLIKIYLSAENELVRQTAVEELGKLKSARQEITLLLLPILKSDLDCDVREAAAEALGELGDPEAVVPLLEALADEDEIVRHVAIKALGEIGDKRALQPLIGAVNSGEYPYVIEALGKLGDPQAIAVLLEIAQDESISLFIRANATDTIGKYALQYQNDEIIETLLVIYQHSWTASITVPPDWSRESWLESYLRFQCDLVKILGQLLSAEKALPLALDLLENQTDWVTRKASAEILAQLKDLRGLAPLLQILKTSIEKEPSVSVGSHEDYVRSVALAQIIEAAGRISLANLVLAETTEVLFRVLDDWGYRVVAKAVEMLGEFQEKSAVPALLALLPKQYHEVQFKILEVLAILGDQSTIEPILATLESRSFKSAYRKWQQEYKTIALNTVEKLRGSEG